METWRLLTTWAAPPGFNMGLDEVLLEREGSPPTLRFYGWAPDTLSLGYFQRLADVPAARRAGALVRRITGGGAIHHHRELTFSIALPLTHRLYRGSLRDSYLRIHGALIEALGVFGVEAHLRGEEQLESDRPGSGMCFHASTPLDVVWGGRKGVGSAQRRRGGRVLHHGSIKLGESPLEGSVASLPGEVSAEAFAPLLVEAFGKGLGLAFEAAVPGEEERQEAFLRGERYESREFVELR